MLKIYNTLTQKKQEFNTLIKNKVNLYVCGITPYDTTHLGHAFTYISFDTLVRALNYFNYSVNYTQNVTDINDRDNDLLKRAKEQNVPWSKLAGYWTTRFLDDMRNLNWIMPTNYLYASKEIKSIIDLIQKIIKKGYGYIINGSVYLDISKKKDFGKLSRLSFEEMIEKAKKFEEDIYNPDKKNMLDITLWKASIPNQPEHIPSFNSPFGKGRPGWHIECSSIAISSLGERIDIHGGGNDLIYPHHESEIAQSESATGKIPFAKYWMHTGTVLIDGKKMSKSAGNLILVRNLMKDFSANAVRFVLLSHHYRSSWNFNSNEFALAEKITQDFKEKFKNNYIISKKTNFKKIVHRFLEDDLNISSVLKLCKKAIDDLDKTKNLALRNDVEEILLMLGFMF